MTTRSPTRSDPVQATQLTMNPSVAAQVPAAALDQGSAGGMASDKAARRLCIEEARAMLEAAYARLPAGYFDGKNAGTYMFNNIFRLVERYPAQPRAAVERVIRESVASADVVGLYAGVPWCEQICSFCNFAYSTSNSQETHEAYLHSILEELRHLRALGLPRVNSLYFGGGTPTVLSDELFARYLGSMIAAIDLVDKAGITCEATTNTLTATKMNLMLQLGVNRLSMGIQSLDDRVREQAKLRGSASEARAAVEAACERFKMVNVDLIYGHPFQSLESWHDSVEQCAELLVPSITLYRLEVKERTSNLKLYKRERGLFHEELAARQQYFVAKLLLERHGYVEHPLGWWIRKEAYATDANWRQHLTGWGKAIPYIGVGQGAFSLSRNAYLENPRQHSEWSRSVAAGEAPASVCREFGPEVSLMLQVMRTFRTAQRVALSEIADPLKRFGLLERVRRVLDRNLSYGLLYQEQDQYVLTDAGRSLVHWLLDDLVEACQP